MNSKKTFLCVKSKMNISKSANLILCVLDIPFFCIFSYLGKSRTLFVLRANVTYKNMSLVTSNAD